MTLPPGTGTDPSLQMTRLAAVHSEQLFRVMFEQAAVGMALIETTTGRFLRVNQRYCEIVGLSQDEMTATTFMAITHPGDLQADLNNMEELKAGHIHSFSMEKRYFRSDGSIVWVELTVSPMWERGEQPTFHIAVVQDITERKQAQAALRMTEDQLTEILKNSTAMVFLKDPKGRYLLVNQAFEQRFGVHAGQVLGRTDREIFSASQAVMFQAHDQEVIESGMLMEFEEVAQYADGEHTSIVIKFPLRNAENSIYGIGGIVTDITERKRAEQNLADLNATLEQQVAQRTRELEESRELLQAVVEGTSDAVFLKDAVGRYLICNAAAGRFVGRPVHEVLGRDDGALFPFEDAQALMENDRHIMAGGVAETYEETITTADGVLRTFLTTKGPVFDGRRCVTGLFGIARDITERKRAEEQLRESELRFRALAERIGDVFWISDPSNRKLVYVSQAFANIWGRNPQALYDHFETWLDAIHEDDRARVAKTFFENIFLGTYDVEYRIMRPNGSIRWIRDRGKPLGIGTLAAGVAEDITERKWAEAALRESEGRFRSIFEHAGTGIAITDLEGRFLQCNPAYCELLGYTEAELRELNFKQVVHPADLAANLVEVDRLFAQEVQFFEIENRSRHKHGHDVWVHKFVSMLRDDSGKPATLFTLVTNITERRQAQELLEQRVAERTAQVHEREAVLTRLLAHFPGVVSRVDQDLTYRFASPQYEEWFGKKSADIVGRSIMDVIGQASFERAKPAIERALAGESVMFENTVKTPTGEVRHGLVTFEPELDENDNAIGFSVYAVDITARKQVEEALRASEAFTREVLDSLSAHVAVLDVSGVIVAVNRVWEQAALRNDPSGQAHISLGANYVKVCERAAETSAEARRTLGGICDVMAGRTLVFEHEYLCVWPGHKQWFSMRVTPLSDQGGCVIVHEDVTDRKLAELALGESEERLRMALDGADMGSWDVDLRTGGAIWNQRHAMLHGYRAHDQRHTMQQWQDRVHPEDLERTLVAAEQAKRERTPFIVEHRVCLPQSDELRWISLYGRFRYDELGTPVRFSGISLDITERRRAETERQKFVSLVENSREFIGICDLNLRPLYVNAAGLRLVGLDGLDHACRVMVSDYFFEEDRLFITEEFFPRVRREGHGEVEIRFRHFQTGQPIWMLCNVFSLWDGYHPIGWATVSRDITERKRGEEALRDTHMLLHNIINATPDLIFVKDHALRTVLCNNAFAQAQGKTPGELIGHTDIENGWSPELVRGNPEKGIRGFEQDDLDALNGQVVHNPYDPANVNGEIRIFDTFKVPLQDATGSITRLLGVARDITERKQVEKALRDSYHRLQTLSREVEVTKEKERSRLSRELHDEFGQVLSGLKLELTTVANAMKRASVVPSVHGKMDSAIEMVDRLFRSLREMVSALRPSVLEELGLVSALEDLATNVTEQVGLQCSVAADKSDFLARCGPEVERALFRMAQELLTNVVRHAKASSATVTLRRDEAAVVLTVQDDGRGFDVRRVQNKNRFGLRGIQERAELLGGAFAIDSTHKVGTTVTICIPIQLPVSGVPHGPHVDRNRPRKSRLTRKRSRRGH